MSTTTAKPLFQTQLLSTSPKLMYQAPTATNTIIDKLTITNQDSGANAVTVYLVPSGKSVGPSNIITSAYSIAANTAYPVAEAINHILGPGDAIWISVSKANVMTGRGSGREVT